MTDQSTPGGKTDLLTPEEVRRLLVDAKDSAEHLKRHTQELHMDFSKTPQAMCPRLCRDYLTLWDRNKELEKILNARETLGDLLK